MMNQKTSLKGLRVIDFTRVVAGPYSTSILGDLGADVIKIERPGIGDDSRGWGPPFVGEVSSYFLGLNRNRRSVAIDLQTPEGIEIAKKLIVGADVVVESFRPGVMDRLGLGYEELKKTNPGLIYCAISAFGQTGPYHERPGYDLMISALGGLMGVTGSADGEPVKTGVALIDVSTGLHAAIGVLAALHHRTLTGEGQRVDASLLGTELAILINVASEYLIGGSIAKPQGSGHANVAPYQAFPTEDGWVLMGSPNDKLFRKMCDSLGKPEWKDDPRFLTNGDRVKHKPELVGMISAITRTRKTSHWVELLSATGAPVAPINKMDQVFQDPQVKHLNQVAHVEHPMYGRYPVVTSGLRFSETPPVVGAAAPRLGQHTREILEGELGMSESEVGQLVENGVVEYRPAAGNEVAAVK
ncbi:coA-transferase III family protein [Paraburkholderia xenovorans LB400]|uniref:Alpha-methylacyl-CoA racemase n=1 Tax=Paraburkholderia xenovorans (strain LB400) TaxID=266265 RepID=Q13G83_PARXL|nr:CoA transferase [Paraburkholderia xenovorans]ABE36906.1 Alpha-methylacyl-CoA racemase [Paraburkholderia xenovorans LB400]AIP34467.1 coA-transferase III family protein [Paraburkholderia xenovorans LB400]